MASEQYFDQLCSTIRSQQEKWSEKNIRNLLGEPPWDEGTLLSCYYGSITNARIVLESLEGYQVLSFCFGLQKSFNILSSYTDDTLELISKLKTESTGRDFWSEKNPKLRQIKFTTEKALFAVSASSAALIDHQRRVKNKGFYSNEEHTTALKKIFGDSALPAFVSGLRNCMTHVSIVDCDWKAKMDFVTGKNDIDFFLKKDKLLRYDWKGNGKAKVLPFIEEHEFGIKIQDVIKEWEHKSTQYHDWLIALLKEKYKSSIDDYVRCERIVFYESIAAWTAAFRGALKATKKSSSILSEEEIQEVLNLPNRKEQRLMLQSLYEEKYGINPIDRIFD